MSKDLINKPLFVVIYPYKFTDFVYDLIELDEFKHYCDVQVWDISSITTPKFSKNVSAKRSSKKEVVEVLKLLDFIRRVYELRQRSFDTKICILNKVTYFTTYEFICNIILSILLKKRNIAIIDLKNGGIPLRYIGETSKHNKINLLSGFIAKVNCFAKDSTTISEAVKNILGIFLSLLSRIIPSAITHRLVAGEDWLTLDRGKGQGSNQIRLVYGHSHDYSNKLLHDLKPVSLEKPPKKKAVLLDITGPAFRGDASFNGHKNFLTSEVWYPTLVRFFDRLETATFVQIEIAGHYKTVHPPIAPCFGNRPVFYGKTRELVCNSEFVIAITSTAISYAVIFKKPIIFIYSNQLKSDRIVMRNIYGMAEMLGTSPINIDDPPVEITSLLKINEERYLNYEKACLTSAASKGPNVQIILEEIFNIPFDSDLIRQI